MIKFRLECAKGHTFEAWFQNGSAYDTQAEGGDITCPRCGNTKIKKALMAPSVATRRSGGDKPSRGEGVAQASIPAEAVHILRAIRREVIANSEYVGPRFAEEARRIHYKETESRGIYGEATVQDAVQLAEEGIAVHALPHLPEDEN